MLTLAHRDIKVKFALRRNAVMNKALAMKEYETEMERAAKTGIATDKIAEIGTCPRSVDEVFSLGIKLQYYIGGVYMEMAEMRRGEAKKYFKQQAVKQLAIKDEIKYLADNNLNRMLDYFYANGGPVIEPPVSDETAKRIQPFFNRIASSSLDEIRNVIDEGSNYDAENVAMYVTETVADMYSAISRLYEAESAMTGAFKELLAIQAR